MDLKRKKMMLFAGVFADNKLELESYDYDYNYESKSERVNTQFYDYDYECTRKVGRLVETCRRESRYGV